MDYFRGIAFLGVALQHVLGIFAHEGQVTAAPHGVITIGLTFNLVKFAVPAFVLVSGLVLVHKYLPAFTASSFYRKRIRELLIPYLLWTAVFQLYYTGGTGQPTINPGIWVHQAITGSASYHLWYVVLLLQFYFLFPLFLPIFRWLNNNQKNIGLILLAAALLYVFMMWFSCYYLPNHPTWPDSGWGQLLVKYRDRNMLFWFFYFLAGGVIALRITDFYHWLAQIRVYNVIIWFVLLLWITWELNSGIKNNVINLGYSTTLKPSMFLYTLSSLLLLYDLCLSLKARSGLIGLLFQTYGYYSQGSYFVHPLTLAVAMSVLRHYNMLVSYPLTSMVLAFFICVVLALFTTFTLSLLPGGKWLTGTIPGKKR
ncbi:MAG: acyltransferase [Methylocystaceae bacterium]